MNAEQVAKSLGGAKSGTNGWWNAQCPCHDDNTASLGLHDTEDGGMAWKCMAGCSSKAVGAALRSMNLLPERERPDPTKKKRRGKLVCTYRYEDKNGALVFEVCRFANPKSFAQRRPDQDKPSEYIWDLKDIGQRPLYKLPQLLAADPAEIIFVVEGEKDTDNLVLLGLIATTSAQGALKWNLTDSGPLTGRHIAILPDNDLPGKQHALTIMRDLAGRAASVRVVDLEGLPPKGDISDWIGLGHTAAELRELAAAVPPFEPPDGDGWDFIGQPVANGDARGLGDLGGARAWWGRLLCTKTGAARDCVANVAMVLRTDPDFAGKIFHDEMRECTVLASMPWQPANRLRDAVDVDDLRLAEWLQQHDLPAIKPATARDGLQIIAAENKINPLRDRLDGLKWDGIERLDSWLEDYLGVEKTTYSTTVGRKWMIAAVARVYSPGCKVDNLLVLEGKQDQNKSTVCRILALEDKWFSDEISDIGTKDSAQDIEGKWIIEIAELSSMKDREIERVKAFFSRSISRYRPSYGRRSQDFHRRCIFIGTTNRLQYLSDPTGNRRFWPIRTGDINLKALRRDVEQIWAEAKLRFAAGEQWWLADGEKLAAMVEQELRRQVDPWEELVLDAAQRLHGGEAFKKLDRQGYIEPETFPKTVTVNAILHVLNVPIEHRDQRTATRVGTILTGAGWTVGGQISLDGKRPRFYVPPPARPEG